MSGRSRAQLRRPQPSASSRDVMIGFVNPGVVDSLFMMSMIGVINASGAADHTIAGVLSAECGPLIWFGRNDLIRQWLAQTNAGWFLMLDADMVFAADLLRRLLDAADPVERPIMSGNYLVGGHGNGYAPVMQVRVKPGQTEYEPITDVLEPGGDLIDPMTLQGLGRYPADRVIRINATGAGCLLIHRTVAETMAERYLPETGAPWFSPIQIGRCVAGEDFAFCLRAQQCGFPIYTHTGIKLGHRKVHTAAVE